MNTYEAKQEARRERIQARADRLAKEADSTFARAQQLSSIIPFGQPILVGHHSEGRDRRYRAKIHATYGRAFETSKAAGEAAARAAAIGTGGISSDDPDAIAKLKAELAEDEARQETMKAANAAWRKAGNKAGRQPDGSWLEGPYATYQLSNNSGNMRRIELRIAALEKAATRETKERETASGVRIVENAEANRLQLFFPGKPDAAIRTELKSAGFRWAPSEGAWQRQLSNNAIYMANYILAKEAQK